MSLLLQLTIVLSAYAVTGAVGNVLVLVVYGRAKPKMALSVYIRVLAGVDLLVCCVVIPYTIAFEWQAVTLDVACRGLEILRHALVTFSCQTLCAIAGERYLSVFRPLRLHQAETAKSVITAIAITSVVIASPSATIFSVSFHDVTRQRIFAGNETTEVTTRKGRAYCQFTPGLVHESWATAYQGFLVLEFVAAVLLMIVLYIKMYKEIWRRVQWRRRQRLAPLTTVHIIAPCSPGQERGRSDGDKSERVNSGTMTRNRALGQTTHTSQLVSAWTETPPRCLLTPVLRQEGCTLPSSLGRNENALIGFDSTGDENKDVRPTVSSTELSLVSLGQSRLVRISPWRTRARATTVTLNPAGLDPSYTARVVSSSQSPDKGKRAGTMMSICTAIFVVTWLPFWLDIFNLTCNLTFRYTFFLGHVTNPLVYGAVNSRVRGELKRILLCR